MSKKITSTSLLRRDAEEDRLLDALGALQQEVHRAVEAVVGQLADPRQLQPRHPRRAGQVDLAGDVGEAGVFAEALQHVRLVEAEDRGELGGRLARLRDLAARPGSSETNLMPALIDCARAYATLGEMCGVFRAVFGEYREPVAV